MRLVRLACVTAVAAACGGGGGGGGGTPPPPPPPSGQVASVVITSPSGAQTIAACGTVNFAGQARNAQGNAVTSATINWQANPTATVSFPTATGNAVAGVGTALGSATVTAASGTVSSTGLTVTVQGGGAGTTADVTATASSTFSPVCVTVTAGGTVNWTFVADPPHNATFTGTKPPGGDIGTTQSTTVSRTFATTGTYPYTCTLHQGMNGWVVVQ